MGFYTILRNSQLEVRLADDYQDNGWSFSNGVAVHDDCNTGWFENYIFKPEAESVYTVSFTVASISSESVKVRFGGKDIADINSNGDYSIVVTTLTDEGVRFWADGPVIISNLKIQEGSVNPITILFDHSNKQFVGYSSFNGDFAALFADNLISFKNGSLWVHDKNSERNSFYGVVYDSKVTFYVNPNSRADKDFLSINLDSNKGALVEVNVIKKEGKHRGQYSRIKSGNFVLNKGVYSAPFLRDMNDPRFTDELQALMKGAVLQGKIMKVTITHKGSSEFKLSSVEVEYQTK